MYIDKEWNVRCLEKPQYNFKTKLPADSLKLILEFANETHPYEEMNELQFQWLGQTTWIFSSTFEIIDSDMLQESLVLFLERVDTIADVRVNDKKVGSCKNAFCGYYFDIKSSVCVGTNKIELCILGAESEAIKEASKLPYPVPHTNHPVQSPHKNLIRKTQCHSGWDWGPSLMVSGIYKVPEIISGNGVIIEGVITEMYPVGSIKDDATWQVVANIHLRNTRESVVYLSYLKISISDLNVLVEQNNIEVAVGSSTVKLEMEISGVDLWWPSGYGKQTLYNIEAEIDNHKWKSKIGFRQLNFSSVDDEHGKSLICSVNGVDIFCKGGNWIPMDSMPSTESEERYRYLIESMKDANMNMVRVWGGGQYEHDIFYDICDEQGILIWHDFMFSCALYPSNQEFLENVDSEVRYQLKRLAHHSSIALWCGNNENLGAMKWFEESRTQPFRYVVDYDRLNNGVLAKAVHDLDITRLWWPSSPCAGEGDYSDNWHDHSKGDMHNWMVWHEGKPFESYLDVEPRFCSEFGFQSFPSISSIRSYATEADLNPTSPVMLHHQKNPRGNQIIIETIARYFRFPFDMSDFVYISQVQQAWAIKYAVDAWRSLRPICMGTLYWQINDIWPVASWSSIEYSGHWKLLHYEAKRFFMMLCCSLYVKGDEILGFIINDNPFDMNVDIVITRMRFSGEIVYKKEQSLLVRSSSSNSCFKEQLNNIDKKHEFIILEWRDKKSTAGFNRTFSWCGLPRECEIEEASLKHSFVEEDNKIYVLLETNKPCFYVSLELNSVEDEKLLSQRKSQQVRERFSDNNFLLIPGDKQRIEYIGEKNIDSLKKDLFIRNLRTTY